MADLAIDPTEIRTSNTSGEAARPSSVRKPLLIAGGVTLCLAIVGGTAAAIVSNIKLPSNLSGLAFLPKPEAPRRSEIRIGRLPDMPEIRDGVPAVIGTKPVRTVDQSPAAAPSLGPKAVASTVVPAASLPAAPLPTTFTGAGSPQLISTVSASLPPPQALVGAAASPAPAARVTARIPAAPPPAAEPAREPEVKSAALPAAMKPEPVVKVEPASTASVATIVPLPPPAPVRSARAPEVRPEKPPRPPQLAARPQPAQPLAPEPAEAVAPPAPPPDDRLEILGVKLPNGNDVKNAVSSIGQALNLPKAF